MQSKTISHQAYIEGQSSAGEDTDQSDQLESRCRRIHIWTTEERETLCLLRSFYSNDSEDYTSLFNHMFNCKLKTSTLDWQWRDMRTTKDGQAVWKSILDASTVSDVRSRFAPLKNLIEDIARDSEIELKLATKSSWSSSLNHSRTTRKRKGSEDVSYLPHLDEESEDDETERRVQSNTSAKLGLVTPKRRENIFQLATPPTSNVKKRKQVASRIRNQDWSSKMYPIIRGPEDGDVSDARPLPSLFFRFSNTESQGLNCSDRIIAGLFVSEEDRIIPSYQYDELSFQVAATCHLERKKIRSPLISLFSTLRPALYRALKNNLDAHITIVDPRKVIEIHRKRYGTANGAIFSTRDIVSKYELELEGNYTAPKEWFVWAEVPKAAIVCRFALATFRTFLEGNPRADAVLQTDVFATAKMAVQVCAKLTYPSHLEPQEIGSIVGNFLKAMEVPTEYCMAVGGHIRRMWKLHKAPYKPYMKAIETVYHIQASPEPEIEDIEQHEGDDSDGESILSCIEVVPLDDDEDWVDTAERSRSPSYLSNWSSLAKNQAEGREYGDTNYGEQTNSPNAFARDLIHFAKRDSPTPSNLSNWSAPLSIRSVSVPNTGRFRHAEQATPHRGLDISRASPCPSRFSNRTASIPLRQSPAPVTNHIHGKRLATLNDVAKIVGLPALNTNHIRGTAPATSNIEPFIIDLTGEDDEEEQEREPLVREAEGWVWVEISGGHGSETTVHGESDDEGFLTADEE